MSTSDSTLDRAYETYLRNIETTTGKSLDELGALVKASGLTRHGELRGWAQKELGLGYGYANALIHHTFKTAGPAAVAGVTTEAAVDEIYTGPKAALRPIHDTLLPLVEELGEFEIAPKKGYISLRRKKQFGMVGPATNTRVEVGLNLKGIEGTERLKAQAPGGMCQFKVQVTDASQVDDELMGWIRQAYDQAG